MSTEQHQAVNPGESAMFNCEAIGNPPPKIIWKKIGDGQVIAHGSRCLYFTSYFPLMPFRSLRLSFFF